MGLSWLYNSIQIIYSYHLQYAPKLVRPSTLYD